MSTTTYRFKAANEASYVSLAAFAVTLPVNVSLFPRLRTVAVPEKARDEVGEFIGKEAPDTVVSIADTATDDINDLLYDPASDTSILRDIACSFQEQMKGSAQMMKEKCCEIEELRRSNETYKQKFHAEFNSASRIEKQIKSIAVLVNSIFPEK